MLGTWDVDSRTRGLKSVSEHLLQIPQLKYPLTTVFRGKPRIWVHMSGHCWNEIKCFLSELGLNSPWGGLSVTPRAGVKVDQQPDGFTFPHSFSLFSYCGRYSRASQILKRDGISGRSLLLLENRRSELLSPMKKEKILNLHQQFVSYLQG